MCRPTWTRTPITPSWPPTWSRTIEPILLVDDNTPPTSGNVKVRIVHGAPSAPAVDVYVTAPGADLDTSTPTLTNVSFGVASGYLSVPAGSYQIRVTLGRHQDGGDRF